MKGMHWFLIILFLIIIILGGCSRGQPALTDPEEFNIICLNGVLYYVTSEYVGYKGYGYMAPVYGTDGEVVFCQTFPSASKK